MDLAQSLRDATWPKHRAVESSAFVRALLAGQLDRHAYCLMLRSLHEIYAALESALDAQAGHRALAAVDLPVLRRADPLAEDLCLLHGERWRDDLGAQPAALDYAERLIHLGARRPELLLAHAYVRYLGDLSGGQTLRRVVQRSFDLAAGHGTRFYEFGDPAAMAQLAQGIRAKLAAVDDGLAPHAEIVGEAQHAFELHARLFVELEQSRHAG